MYTYRKMIAMAVAIAGVFVVSCQKEQDFSYGPVEEVTIGLEETSYSVVQLGRLHIAPTISLEGSKDASYTYKWSAFLENGEEKPVVLSIDRILDVEVALTPNTYKLKLEVKNEKTGVTTLGLYDLIVNGAFYEGWFVANNKDGHGVLSFIREDDAVYLDPLKDAYDMTFDQPVVSVQPYVNSIYDFKQVLFFTESNAYRFNPDDLVKVSNTSDIFDGPHTFGPGIAYGLDGNDIDQYLINHGDIYVSMGPLFGIDEAFGTYSARLSGDYDLYPAIIKTTPFNGFETYFYDNKNKHFKVIYYLDRTLYDAQSSPSGLFDLSNVGMTMVGMDIGPASYQFIPPSTLEAVQVNYFVMQDDNGTRYLYALSGTTPEMKQEIHNSPGIAEAGCFATLTTAKLMYYGTGRQVYVYDMLANTSRLLYTFPAGSVVKDLKIDREKNEERLVAAVNTANAGEVYYFDLANTGDFVGSTFTNRFTGFGEIIELNYRKSN